MKDKLYKSHGVLWRTIMNNGNEWISDNPLCPNSSCHTILQNKNDGYYCVSCEIIYPKTKQHADVLHDVRAKWEGFQTLDHEVYSLDLPPTAVKDEDHEDENYWVQAKISEKDGKRMAVVYFGERVKAKQDKKDYTQIFLDFDDEQLRFDKNNKNPMKLLAKLTAEFPDSKHIVEKNK